MSAPTASDMPNYKHGIRHAVWAVRTASGGSVSYGAVHHEPGMEAVTPNAATTNSTTFHSDDGKAATVNGASGNTTITVQVADVSNDYQTQVMGHKIDGTTGALLVSDDDEAERIAFGYEVQGTKHKTRIWWSNCESTEPTSGAHQTDGENVTESADTLTLTVNGEKYGKFAKCVEGEPGFDTFLDSVPACFTSGPTAPDVTLSVLTIGSLTLTPTFDKDTTSYAAATTNATDTITATPTASGATVEIKNGTTTVASGSAATWSTGQNTVTVKVTNGTSTKTYTVTVTKS